MRNMTRATLNVQEREAVIGGRLAEKPMSLCRSRSCPNAATVEYEPLLMPGAAWRLCAACANWIVCGPQVVRERSTLR